MVLTMLHHIGHRALRLLAIATLIAGSLAIQSPVQAATIAATTTCGNSVDNTPGLGVICEVTIVNSITSAGGSSVVTVRECHGPAGDPEAACVTVTDTLPEPVTAVDQCNAAENGGGGTVRCSVNITNDFVDQDPPVTAVTVNQCVGSGDGITVGCDPFPATTTGATITQCNGSANGGTLVGLICTASGTETAAFAFTVSQCNDTANGGGSLVICSVEVETTSSLAAPTATPTPSASAPTAEPSATVTRTDRPAAPTPPATDVLSPSATSSSPLLVIGLLIFIAVVAIVSAARMDRRRTSR